MSKKRVNETIMCDYYAKNSNGLKREYGEVNTGELTNIKGFNLPVHTSVSKLFKK
jgi:hypothetical protein